jgi:hypothetical protein
MPGNHPINNAAAGVTSTRSSEASVKKSLRQDTLTDALSFYSKR